MKISTSAVILCGLAFASRTNGHSLRVLEEAGVSENPDMFEGDIVPVYEDILHHYGQQVVDELVEKGILKTPEQEGRQLGLWTNRIWTDRDSQGRVVIPVAFQSSYPSAEYSKVWDALKFLEDNVPSLKFVQRTSESAYINVQGENSGCWSYVGRTGGAQQLNLASGCRGLGVVTHEFMHALSVFHEQSRPDRDGFVTVNYDNVRADYISNFFPQTMINSLGSPYDYQSVMHYGAFDFGKRAITCTDAGQICRAVQLQFVGVNQDGSNSFCIGSSGTLTSCSGSSDSLWLVKRYDSQRIRFHLRSDDTQCLDVGDRSGGVASLKPCRDDLRQTFQIHGSLTGNMNLRWEGDNYLCLRRNPAQGQTTSSASSEGLLLTVGSCDSASATFKLSQTYTSAPCVTAMTCENTGGRMQVIFSKNGESIRGSQPSAQDLAQLSYLYQCPSGPRTAETLCSSDCPCFEGQYSCKTDVDCRGSLRCSPERTCVQGNTLPVLTASPTTYPTAYPTVYPTTLPTEQTMTCEVTPAEASQYQSQVKLAKDFELSFLVKLNSVNTNSWTNLVHVGSDGNDRIVSIFFPKNSAKMSVRVASENAWNNRCDPTIALSLGDVYAVRIQVYDAVLKVFFNDIQVCSTNLAGQALGAPNGKPVFTSVAGYEAPDACMQGISFSNLSPLPVCSQPEKGKAIGMVTLGENFEISAKIKLEAVDETSWTNIFHIGSSNYPRYASMFVYPASSRVTFRVASKNAPNNACTSSKALVVGQEHLIRLVVKGEYAKAFIDGSEVCSVLLVGGQGAGINNEPFYMSHPGFEAASACVSDLNYQALSMSEETPAQSCSDASNRRNCPRDVCSWGRMPGSSSRKRVCFHNSLKQSNLCSRNQSFEKASEFCQSQGLELCTVGMLTQQLAGDDTCRTDRKFIWVSDNSCGAGKAMVYRGRGGKTLCLRTRVRRSVRCC